MKVQTDEPASPKKLRLPTPKINVTPLVDILLVLLIIFFVIEPRKEAKFDSRVPQQPDQTPGIAPLADLLLVDLKSGTGLDQVVELNSKSVSLAELGVTLKLLLEQRPEKTVYIKAPREKRYGEVAQVIDIMKGAGAEPIGLQVDFLF